VQKDSLLAAANPVSGSSLSPDQAEFIKRLEERWVNTRPQNPIGAAMSTEAYEFPRRFHNERVDSVMQQMADPKVWGQHLRGEEIFSEGYDRDIYRGLVDYDRKGGMDPSLKGKGPKKDLPGLLSTFLRSVFD
jgi:hypothetical protein